MPLVLADFDFDVTKFSSNMSQLINQKPVPPLEQVRKMNNERLESLKLIANYEKDPFLLIDEDLELIKTIIFDQIINTNYDKLKEVAEYNLKLKGKNFRSWIIMLLSRALYSNTIKSQTVSFEDTEWYYNSALLSACVEICHNATLLQDDIIDKAETRRSELAAYKVYGQSKSIFASNFLISRASHILATLETPYLSQVRIHQLLIFRFSQLLYTIWCLESLFKLGATKMMTHSQNQ